MFMCYLYGCRFSYRVSFFFLNAPATTEFYPFSLHDALPILAGRKVIRSRRRGEVVALLPGRADAVADDVGEDLAEPRTAGEDVGVRLDLRAVGGAEGGH